MPQDRNLAPGSSVETRCVSCRPRSPQQAREPGHAAAELGTTFLSVASFTVKGGTGLSGDLFMDSNVIAETVGAVKLVNAKVGMTSSPGLSPGLMGAS